MSVKRNVTVPAGRSSRTPGSLLRSRGGGAAARAPDRVRRLRAPRLPLLRARAADRAGPPVRRRLRRPADPHLVVRVVAARDRARAEPVRHARRLGAGGAEPRLGEHGAGAFRRLRSPDGAPRAGAVLRRGGGRAARARGVDGVPALPPPHRQFLAVALRRLPVRLLELRARPRARAAAADGGVRTAADRARDRAGARGGAPHHAAAGAPDRAPDLPLERARAHGDDRPRAGARAGVPARTALAAGAASPPRAGRARVCGRRSARRACSLLLAHRSARFRLHAAGGLHGRPAEPVHPVAPRGRRGVVGALGREALPGQQHRAGVVRRDPTAPDHRPLRRAELAHLPRAVPARLAARRDVPLARAEARRRRPQGHPAAECARASDDHDRWAHEVPAAARQHPPGALRALCGAHGRA